MIRFWLGDESFMSDDPCACGRTFPRLPSGVVGRLDDMLIIRGANVYPSAIEAVITEDPRTGSEYRVVVDRAHNVDELIVEVEASPEPGSAEAEALTGDLAEQLKTRLVVRVQVKLVPPQTFEPQIFKARRVIDRRSTDPGRPEL